jgi:hypothetical protein
MNEKRLTLSKENPAELISYNKKPKLAKIEFLKDRAIGYVYFKNKRNEILLKNFNEEDQKSYKKSKIISLYKKDEEAENLASKLYENGSKTKESLKTKMYEEYFSNGNGVLNENVLPFKIHVVLPKPPDGKIYTITKSNGRVIPLIWNGETFKNPANNRRVRIRGGEIIKTIPTEEAQDLPQFKRSTEVLKYLNSISLKIENIFTNVNSKKEFKLKIKPFFKIIYLSMLKQESGLVHKNGKTITTSLVGASGISQMMPATAKSIIEKYGDIRKIKDGALDQKASKEERDNLKLGYLTFLDHLYDGLKNAKLGDDPSEEDILAIAATAYNGGADRVGEGFGIGNYKKYSLREETKNYVARVLENYGIYNNIYSKQGTTK